MHTPVSYLEGGQSFNFKGLSNSLLTSFTLSKVNGYPVSDVKR